VIPRTVSVHTLKDKDGSRRIKEVDARNFYVSASTGVKKCDLLKQLVANYSAGSKGAKKKFWVHQQTTGALSSAGGKPSQANTGSINTRNLALAKIQAFAPGSDTPYSEIVNGVALLFDQAPHVLSAHLCNWSLVIRASQAWMQHTANRQYALSSPPVASQPLDLGLRSDGPADENPAEQPSYLISRPADCDSCSDDDDEAGEGGNERVYGDDIDGDDDKGQYALAASFDTFAPWAQPHEDMLTQAIKSHDEHVGSVFDELEKRGLPKDARKRPTTRPGSRMRWSHDTPTSQDITTQTSGRWFTPSPRRSCSGLLTTSNRWSMSGQRAAAAAMLIQTG